MTKNQKRAIAVLTILFVIFTVIAFALPFKRNGLFCLSYVFGIIAIAVQLYVLKVAFDGADSVMSKFYGFPIAQIGIIYMVVQFVLSIIFMALAAIAPMWIAVILFIVALAAGALGFIGADVMRDEIERQDINLKTDISCMITLRSLIYPLVDRCENKEAKKALVELADEFRYSDPVSSDALKTIESELEMSVVELQDTVLDGKTERICSSCKKVSGILEERKRLCKLNKKK